MGANPGSNYDRMTDGALLGSVLCRDERAWRELLSRYRPLMYRCLAKVACRYGARLSNEDQNEMFGELCVNLLRDDMRKLRAYDPARGSKLGTWLGLIAINTAYDFLRASRRRPFHDNLDDAPERAAPEPSALDALLRKERCLHLSSLLVDFSERDRRFVELYYGQGLLPEEVAAAMRISVKTVYSKKNKVRTRLEAAQKMGTALLV